MQILRNKIFTTLVILVGIAAFSGCATTDPEQTRSAMLKAEMAAAHMKGGNYPSALRELLSAEQEDPNNSTVHELLGRVYYARERFDLAEKHFLKSLTLDKNHTSSRVGLAYVYLDTGRLSKAEEQLKVALNDLTYGPYYDTLAAYGIYEYKSKRYDKAVEYFKKSLERDRENCVTNVWLGRSYMESLELDVATSQLDKAISFCSAADLDIAHYYSAIAWYRKKEFPRAKSRFEELLKLFPNGPNAEKSQKMLAIINNEVL